MDKYFAEATFTTPMVNLNPEKGLVELIGKSIPEDIEKVYTPIIEWLRQYLENPCKKTLVNINLDYINSSSTRKLLLMINLLQAAHKAKSTEVSLNWLYSEDDILEYGEDFEQLSDLKFNFIHKHI